MFPVDEENTAFITEYGLYYWRVMLFGLNNAGATYQRMSKTRADHMGNFRETINRQREILLKVKPEKYLFGIISRKILGT
ncbi:hypothetical protein LIER_41095 [Lithospermum erythrorhizon]|uniref:Uncharacterized protein n=1 Tax=Lithospermum erythrorhizon TaxID=34254 RepID=A0AAV3R490_LITER